MATTQGNLSEVAVTFSNGTTIAYASRCPAGETLREFLQHLVSQLIAGVGAGKTFSHTDSTGTVQLNRQEIESFTVTFG